MTFAERFDGFFADYGEAVSLGTSTGTAIVDAAVDEYDRVLTSAMMLTVATHEWPALAERQAASVRGVSYTVRAVKPDGTGITLVEVTKP